MVTPRWCFLPFVFLFAISSAQSQSSGGPGTATPTSASASSGDAAASSSSAAGGADPKTNSGDKLRSGGRVLRSIVGFEQAGASSASSTQHFFLDLYGSQPLWRAKGQGNDPYDLGPKLRGWFNLRISSTPQQVNTSVAQFTSTFAQKVGELKVNEVAQSFEFLAGVAYRLWNWESTFAGPESNTAEKLGVHIIAGGGVATPITPKDSVQIFQVPQNQQNFFTTYPQANGAQFVAFTLPDRNRFFREAYGGFRLVTRTWWNGKTDDKQTGGQDPCKDKASYCKEWTPSVLDVTYGFNEAITGGVIHGGVMRVEGFVPLPLGSKVESSVYLFATGLFKFSRARVSTPFILDGAPQGTSATSAQTVVITTPQDDRDYYRIGMGVDLVNIIGKWANKSKIGKNQK